MSYQVLARKWRPQNFKQMVGQEHVLKALIHALESQRLHHAYLFTGTRGVGKTTIGRILAKCLSCHVSITAEPCGECGACQSISQGRYVDLIEIDAASRTKVEDMREFLDNVQYAPAEGRFKIYLIDEVHMLSSSSFNALLKTLEEPPEHVKFLFATTDPQKLPVTILSRCLQFNLKNMSPERIVGHLHYILSEEQVSAEEPALWALARAADGSMRDALSLTDQAIAYGNNVLTELGVSAMLGTVDQKKIYRILDALVAQDARSLLDEVADLAEFSPDYSSVLASLISVLHRVAVEQVLPGSVDNSMGDQAQVSTYAQQLSAEDLQLFYQIALLSRQDLAITPDPRAGLEMALLRMLAFQTNQPSAAEQRDMPVLAASENQSPISAEPQQLSETPSFTETPLVEEYDEVTLATGSVYQEEDLQSSAAVDDLSQNDTLDSKKKTDLVAREVPAQDSGQTAPVAAEVAVLEPSPELASDAVPETAYEPDTAPAMSPALSREMDATDELEWPKRALQVPVTGMTQNLLLNMALLEEDSKVSLYVDSGHFRLLNNSHEVRIESAIKQLFGENKVVVFVDGLLPEQETPMMWKARKTAEMLVQAKHTIHQDPNVKSLIELFDGVVIEESIQALGELI